MVAGIISAFIVPDPSIGPRVNVGRRGMPRSVVEFAVILRRLIADRCVLRHCMRRTHRTAGWNVAATHLWSVETLVSSSRLTAVLVAAPGLSAVLVSTTTPLLGNHEC